MVTDDGSLRIQSNRIHAADAQTEQALTVESLRVAKGPPAERRDQFITLPENGEGIASH